MSQVTSGQASAGLPAMTLEQLYAPVREELERVESILRGELRSRHAYVDELVRYGCLLGGKRLRPALVLLSGRATGALRPEHCVLAAVVEMIHTATLVHDDVLDEAETRRHLATVHSRWDNKASVLLGDFLFTHAFYLASTLDSTWACREIGRATNIVCEGELRQKGCVGRFDLAEQEYLEIVSAKTAELCACSCRLGAHYAGADTEQVERLTSFGRDLGIAFQIMDDVLDLQGEEERMGKSLGTDLEQQKPTLPIIHLLQHAPPPLRQELLERLAQGSLGREELLPHLEAVGGLEYARRTARWHLKRAAEQLAALPESDAKTRLGWMHHFVLLRSR